MKGPVGPPGLGGPLVTKAPVLPCAGGQSARTLLLPITGLIPFRSRSV